MADTHGLTPLSAFESYDPSDVAGLLDEDAIEDLPEVQWSDPAAGLTAVRALAGYLLSNTEAVPDQAKVLADLAGVAAELADAERAGVRFRFGMVL